MIAIQKECLTIGYETGQMETILSNGWTVKQHFNWFVDADGVHVEYDPEAMEVIGAEQVEEYSAEEIAALGACEWEPCDLKTEICGNKYYEEAEKEFKASLDAYAYYGVSERDFCSR